MLITDVVHCVYESFGWTINQIYFWGEKAFPTGCLMDNLIFLILTLAAAQQVFKKYHVRYHALDAVAARRHYH